MAEQALYTGTGRRKTSVARVRLVPGDGRITVNGRDYAEYFPRSTYQAVVSSPLKVLEAEGRYDVIVKVEGGGPNGPGRGCTARHSALSGRGISGGTRRAQGSGSPHARRPRRRAQEVWPEEGPQASAVL
jgi:hypothetical protein